jgi:hypothetical protein
VEARGRINATFLCPACIQYAGFLRTDLLAMKIFEESIRPNRKCNFLLLYRLVGTASFTTKGAEVYLASHLLETRTPRK